MGNVVILDENTINKIAAGEVVDRPASIVKELVENSIDAGATHIDVEIKNGGISYIKITDNGKGIASDDVELAFERHATSKIRKESDILNITSMGFRGEALASIASISKVTLETKTKDESVGTKMVIEGGNIVHLEEIAWNMGTTITIENVFYNVPARYKFLKKDYTEAGYIEDVVTRMSLINPHISFRYINSGKQILQTSGNTSIKDTIFSVFGKDIASNLIPVEYDYEDVHVFGVVGMPQISRSTRQNEFTYINSRYVKDKTITAALEKAFDQKLNIGKFPFAILNLKISPTEVDVNVHPAKLEVKFENESKVFETVFHGVTNALLEYHKKISPFTMQEETQPKTMENIINIVREKSTTDDLENKITSKFSYIMQDVDSFKPVYYDTKEQEIEFTDIVSDVINENANKEQYETKTKYRYIGCLFDTYILIEIGEKLYIIDQHAAHERLLYEGIKNIYYSKARETQMLLVPVLVELKNKDKEFVFRNIELFERTGFIIDEFGDNAIKISGVPNIGYDIDYIEMFKDVIDGITSDSKTTKEEKETRFIYTLACKAAVKANMKLSKEEHISLIDNMMKLERPFTCPHGRPTAYEISKYEIERRFSRK